MYKPRIATHWTKTEAEITYQCILAEAKGLTEEEIIERTQKCMDEADTWAKKMIHTPELQDAQDRMYGRWVSDASEMAAIWCMV